MDGLFIEYRDPLFGIMVFFALIFTISFLTYSFNLYKERSARAEYRELLKRFDLGTLKEEDYVHLYKTYNLPFDSIVLLASTFLHRGNYNKAISVYLALLEHVEDRVKKEELLELLGSTYFKGGFLQRSKDIYLQILKFSPRNINALHYLLIIYEKLKEYDKSLEVLGSLDELGEDIKNQKTYLETLQIINDPLINFDKKSSLLFDIYKEHKFVERLVAEFLLKFNKTLFWENLESFEIKNIIDLLWYLDFNDIDFSKVSDNTALEEIYSAKGYIDTAKSSNSFELNAIIMLLQTKSDIKGDLNFEFLCKKCKNTFPIFESRCPHCHSIMNFKVQSKLTRKHINEESISLQ